VRYADGRTEWEIGWALEDAEAVIACMGFTPAMEGEEMGDTNAAEGGGDRVRIGLPGKQLDLLKKLHDSGKPVILVLTGGSPIELNWAKANLPAILMVWYPGEAGGQALADVLFGDYSPAGRLPLSFVKSLDDLPPFTDYAMQGRTYRFMEKDVLFPFGHGLSYTTFKYSDLKMQGLTAHVTVRNTGDRDGDEVVQVYIQRVRPGAPRPIRQLAGFQRLHVRQGAARRVRIKLSRRQFAAYDEQGRPFIEPGLYRISVGGGQPGYAPAGKDGRPLSVNIRL